MSEEKPSVESLDWAGIEASEAWREVILPYLENQERIIVDVLSDRRLTNTTDDFAYQQGLLSAIKQMREAPSYYMNLRRNEEREQIPIEDRIRRPLYGKVERYGR